MEKGQFKLLFNEAYVDYSESAPVEIGKIIDTSSGEDVLYIHYERDLYKNCGYHTCVSIYEFGGNEYPVARVDDLNRKCLFDSPDIFLTMMLHELGHYRNGDLEGEGETTEEKRNARLSAILAGKVLEEELRADEFAVRCVGKNTFMRYIDYAIRQRKLRGDEAMKLAIREFELRKKAIQKTKI